MTPQARMDWDIYLQDTTYTREVFNSDNEMYGGTGDVYNPEIRLELVDKDQKKWKLRVNLPPLGAVVLK
jgi:1,4-alpha-glucan branching enzyme